MKAENLVAELRSMEAFFNTSTSCLTEADSDFAPVEGTWTVAQQVAQQAVLLFRPSNARWVSREIWHPKQDGKLQLDGSYMLQFPYSREPELVMDILKHGAGVEVLAPASLRAAVAAEITAAARMYDVTPPATPRPGS